ncbi:MAG: 3-phosphoserine/phosphohydroxythreonine transaminase [Spirochaetes bacterium]|nr:3-phosphoserine/phosphohydroxythreonine transaminase [Spirochaetota bacterium]
MATIYNFNPGPAVLPKSVLDRAQKEFQNYPGLGYSIMEASHRGKQVVQIFAETEKKLLSLMGLGDQYRALFLQGGATMQFIQIPMNFLGAGKKADYIDTGMWTSKAIKEGKRYGGVNVLFSGKDANYTALPDLKKLAYSPDAAYTWMCSNNTIFGTQYRELPDVKNPLISDMSSDILSKRLDFGRFGIIFAGAQKNLGPSGVTLVVIRKDLLDRCNPELPELLSYKGQAENDSMVNTPPVFGVYLMGLMLDWIAGEAGGLAAVEKRNEQKAGLLYGAIDGSQGFYKCPVVAKDRSLMNIVFTLPDEDKTALFVKEAEAAGFVNLKGHRSVGGIRASIYNAMPVEGCEKLAAFMAAFAKR